MDQTIFFEAYQINLKWYVHVCICVWTANLSGLSEAI